MRRPPTPRAGGEPPLVIPVGRRCRLFCRSALTDRPYSPADESAARSEGGKASADRTNRTGQYRNQRRAKPLKPSATQAVDGNLPREMPPSAASLAGIRRHSGGRNADPPEALQMPKRGAVSRLPGRDPWRRAQSGSCGSGFRTDSRAARPRGSASG